ncbi:class I SAM-dependent methyltransferase [Neobacillus sp. LXY-1]|uniref:class I SAM-dependent methyltransferase n=1 Tax=Neobacillus sp. LXY-1 TaxID=3379133 RepID=UPI003EE33FF6
MLTYLRELISNSPNQLITYADFMSEALYHPEYGYYMKERQKIGRQGDFITTSNISDVYGRLVAKWVASLHKMYGLPAAFCEIGGGNGRFSQAFLQEWSDTIKTPLQYFMVESSPFHRALQQNKLQDFPSFVQVDRLSEINNFEGIIFSNELFDALPVHVIEKRNGELVEIMVGLDQEQLCERPVPLTNPAIYSFLQEGKWELKESQRIEIPLAMDDMIKNISATLNKGFVVSVDYGYTNKEWMDPRRLKGSLRGYYQHRMVDNVLINPGEMDITSHIHLDYLIQNGTQVGLQFVSKYGQDEFLLNAGILKELEDHYDPNPFSEQSKRNRAIRSLIMPGGMSTAFQIIIQQKNLKVDEIF